MKNTTPSGTRTFSTFKPLGRTFDSITSPTGFGSIATLSSAAAIDSIRAGIQFQAIDFGIGQTKTGGCVQIVLVGFENIFGTLAEKFGRGAKPVDFLRHRSQRQLGRGSPRRWATSRQYDRKSVVSAMATADSGSQCNGR